MSQVHIENRRLESNLRALRQLGAGPVPAKVRLQMVAKQKNIISHLEAVSDANNALINQFGEKNEAGVDQVTAESEGWAEFQEKANALQLVKYNCGEPFVLYERVVDGETVIGWTDPVKTPLDVSANVIVDAGDLIVIDLLEPEVPEAQVVGHIENLPVGDSAQLSIVE